MKCVVVVCGKLLYYVYVDIICYFNGEDFDVVIF